jgi:hypothetical protein
MTVERSDKKRGGAVITYWQGLNPQLEIGRDKDDGTHPGGWIRDQMRANMERESGLANKFPVKSPTESRRNGN